MVAVAGAVAATGLTVASARQAAGRSGTEYFQPMNTSAANNAASGIIARGVFPAGGVDHPGKKVAQRTFSAPAIYLYELNIEILVS